MSIPARTVFEFGEFIMDTGQRHLVRRASGQMMPLSPKVTDTLIYLLEHGDELLDKGTLLAVIWPNAVVEENSLTQTISTLRRVLGEARGENRYIVTIPGRGYRFVADIEQRAAGPLRTLAVLPFRPLVAADGNESLELGMTETLIAGLNALEGLTVCPLSSVHRFGMLERDAAVVGKELGVDSVLEGSLQREGARLRVSARLVRVRDGRQIWSNRFEEQFTSLFDVQDAIAQRVTEALSVELDGSRSHPQVKRFTQDAQAYQLYANGRLAWSRCSEMGLIQAIDCFKEAIARDGRYARAYAGLSDCYGALAVFGIRAPSEVFPLARDSVAKALEIDPNLAEAHASLGHVKAQYENDWRGAEQAYARAIELDPDYTMSHVYRGILSGYMGKIDRGVAQLRRAQRLEPLWAAPKACVGMLLYYGRRYAEAIAELEQTLAADEGSDHARRYLGRAYLRTNQLERAMTEFARCRTPTPGSFGDIGQALALLGRRTEALAELERLQRLSKVQYVPSYDLAMIPASLGDANRALDWLDHAAAERSTLLGWMGLDPAFDSLHGNARFVDMLTRLDLRAVPTELAPADATSSPLTTG
jgi:serine/threonine-protein kinase